MTASDAILALFGGGLIGISATLMLLFNGRVTGISGIVGGLLSLPSLQNLWRLSFIFGLLTGGAVIVVLNPNLMQNITRTTPEILGYAGLLVGFGTAMSGGCTSGHGVCGISRLSVRSIVATITFIAFGILSATITQNLMGGS